MEVSGDVLGHKGHRFGLKVVSRRKKDRRGGNFSTKFHTTGTNTAKVIPKKTRKQKKPVKRRKN